MESISKTEILSVNIPLVGPRGGKISLSMNKTYTGFGPPAWQKKKRIQEHFKKYIPYAGQENRAKEEELRYVKFVRILGTRARLLDDDNFKGGCKAIRDLLIYRGWIFDDDNKHLRVKYYQHIPDPRLSVTHLMIKVFLADNS